MNFSTSSRRPVVSKIVRMSFKQSSNVEPSNFEPPFEQLNVLAFERLERLERLEPLFFVQTPSMNCSMRLRMAASGRRPRAAPRLSMTYSALAMPGTAQVTAG